MHAFVRDGIAGLFGRELGGRVKQFLVLVHHDAVRHHVVVRGDFLRHRMVGIERFATRHDDHNHRQLRPLHRESPRFDAAHHARKHRFQNGLGVQEEPVAAMVEIIVELPLIDLIIG